MKTNATTKLLLLILLAVNYVTAQVSPIDTSRTIDWTKAGAGTIPNRTTVYTTLNPGVTSTDINSAIALCPAGQVVLLNPGTYNLSAGIDFSAHNNVTLRGSGPDSTFLVFTGTNGCGGKNAAICVGNGYLASPNTFNDPGPNYSSWTAGYSRGTNSITIGAVSGIGEKPTLGTIMQLEQLSTSTDDGTIFVTSESAHVQSGSSTPGWNQNQLVTVTGITSGPCPCTVDISPAIYMPNWKGSQTPRAWWTGNQPSNTVPITGAGIEGLSLDLSPLGTSFSYGITYFWATNSWIKNVRMVRTGQEPVIHASNKMILLFLSTHITIRDSYFFGRTGDDDYVIDPYTASDNLIENNIMQRMPLSYEGERSQGNVFSYNYSIRGLWGPPLNGWAQGSSSYHAPGSSFELHEGNDGHGLELENYFGQAHFITGFRNRWTGFEATQYNQTVPVFIYALNRYENIVGNVLGTGGYHTTYSSNAGESVSNCPLSIYSIGLGSNCANGGTSPYPPNDPLTVSSLLRWGNWDVVTNGTKFDNAEVPSLITPYGNPIPTTQVLPSSLYIATKPVWFGSTPWPPIGPDVTTGDIPNVGGHANRIPARRCFEDVMGGTYNDSIARPFNADKCLAFLTGIKTPSTFDKTIIIYPNPTAGIINLKMSKFEDLKMESIEIYNLFGEKIYSLTHLQISTSSNFQIDLSGQPNGIYFVQLKNNAGEISTKKISVISNRQ